MVLRAEELLLVNELPDGGVIVGAGEVAPLCGELSTSNALMRDDTAREGGASRECGAASAPAGSARRRVAHLRTPWVGFAERCRDVQRCRKPLINPPKLYNKPAHVLTHVMID